MKMFYGHLRTKGGDTSKGTWDGVRENKKLGDFGEQKGKPSFRQPDTASPSKFSIMAGLTENPVIIMSVL